MTTQKGEDINSKKTNLKAIKKDNKGHKDNKKKDTTTVNNKNKIHNKKTIKKSNISKPKKSLKKHTQTGGSDVCNRDLNDLLTGNPLVMTGKESDFSGDLNKVGKGFADDVMGSFKGVDDGWGGNPGMPPKLPSGCTII
jgi:hypothetical protein